MTTNRACAARVSLTRLGASVNGIHCSWPLATLRVSAERLDLQVPLADVVVVSRGEVTEVRTTSSRLGYTLGFQDAAGRLGHVVLRLRNEDGERLLRGLSASGW